MGERGRDTAEAAGSSPAPPTIVQGLLRVPEFQILKERFAARRQRPVVLWVGS